MSVKIRLTRTGRHNDPFYRIVVADQRYARDGKYIEQIGYFDPNKGLASATLDEEKALTWLKNGATPSDTIRALFSDRGLMTKHAATKSGKKPGKTKKPATKKAAEAKKPAAKKESK